MKKYIRLTALFLFIIISLCGCQSRTQVPQNDPADQIVVGFSQLGAESEWRRANTKSMQEAFSDSSRFRLIMDDAQQKQEKQITAIRNFIQLGVDYIVLAPVTEGGWETVLAEAKNAGIPVIIVDRMLDCADDTLYMSWVGSDFVSEGEKAVAWLEEHTSSPLRIVHLQGTFGSSAQLGRTQALDRALEKHSDWQLVWRETGDFTQARGQEIVRKLISDGVEFDTIYAENDDMAYGAIYALTEAGLECGKDVTVISFDANRKALNMVLSGELALDVECNPLHGPRVRALIDQKESGLTPAKQTFVSEAVFDRSNVTQDFINFRGY